MATDGSGRGSLRLAVSVLVLLAAAPNGQLSSRALAIQTGSHEVTLRRLLSSLRLLGLVEGRAGRTGGWALARAPARIGLGDLHRALRVTPAARGRRSLVAIVLAEAEEAFAARLDRVTIADLAQTAGRPVRDS